MIYLGLDQDSLSVEISYRGSVKEVYLPITFARIEVLIDFFLKFSCLIELFDLDLGIVFVHKSMISVLKICQVVEIECHLKEYQNSQRLSISFSVELTSD